MKVEIKENDKVKERGFPKLMVCIAKYNTGMIVFFEKEGKGQVLNSGSSDNIGDIAHNWDMGCFTDFEGSITLSND